MTVTWKDSSDPERLRQLIHTTSNAKQRDRYRVVLLAGEGLGDRHQLSRDEIAAVVGRSRQFVDRWVKQYRQHGIKKLLARRQKGRSSKLSAQEQEELKKMLDTGPTAQEAISAYNGPILKQKIKEHFNKVYSLSGVYDLLHRLGYNDLMPRPQHPETDPAALEAFKKKSSPRRWRRSKPLIPRSAC